MAPLYEEGGGHRIRYDEHQVTDGECDVIQGSLFRTQEVHDEDREEERWDRGKDGCEVVQGGEAEGLPQVFPRDLAGDPEVSPDKKEGEENYHEIGDSQRGEDTEGTEKSEGEEQ